MWKAILVVSVVVSVVSCAGWDDPNPAAFAPSKDYPCGVIGVVCLNQSDKPNGFCCNDGETCGSGRADVGCPADACCNIRDFFGARTATMDGGSVPPPTWVEKHKQTRAQ
jgi:hypothetical protein